MGNTNNLGYNVTTRTVNWLSAVQEAWGVEFNKRDVVYEFSNGSTRLDDDNTSFGIYGIVVLSGLVIDGGTGLYDGLQLRILAETGQMIGADLGIPDYTTNLFAELGYEITTENNIAITLNPMVKVG